VSRSSLIPALGAMVVVAMFTPRPAASQTTIEASVNDSVAKVVRRQRAEPSRFIETRSGDAALLLTDSTVVLQMTSEGLARIRRDAHNDRQEGFAARLVGAMVRAGIAEMLDHGISYRLDRLARAQARGSRLYLIDYQGSLVFDSVSVNKRPLMHDFSPLDAERFSRRVNEAIRRRAAWRD